MTVSNLIKIDIFNDNHCIILLGICYIYSLDQFSTTLHVNYIKSKPLIQV